MLTFICFIMLSSLSLANGYQLPWSWDKVPLWADFGIKNKTFPALTDYQAKFMATHYDIISIEKCIGEVTEESFYNISSSIRKYTSTNETKILMYFAVDVPYCSCYNVTNSVCNNQSMWFRDDAGNIIYAGNKPFYDYAQKYVQDWWVNATTFVLKTALSKGIIVNGIFADGLMKNFTQSNFNVSLDRNNEWQHGAFTTMDKLRNTFKKMNDDLFVIGNGIKTYSYSFPPNNYGLEAMHHVDGLMYGHYGSFEEVNNHSNGTINASDILLAFNMSKQIVNGDYGQNKALLIKGWIGPESSPTNDMGPTWPTDYDVTPNTSVGIQQAALDKISYPLATFLCGIMNNYMYFAYAWFWDILEGWVPCPHNPNSCDCPINWYQEFVNKLGKPISDGILTDTYKCNRTFEYAKVYVDLTDNTSANIQWLQTN
eukprot:246808_1